MAESIVRLRVSSDEYDNKLKRASEALNRYVDGCRKAGGTLEHVDDGVLEFTRSLGRMETTANTAKGKLSEMTKVFTDLSVQYKNMTDQEKKGEFGKAINASLGELKGRIQESKAQLDDVNKSLNGGSGLGGALDSIASKFGVNIDQLTKLGSVIGATSAALKVAKDAFFQNETNVDDWGRTVASAEGIYDSFLQTLNNGDFSGFISRIGEVITKAQEAYNALDELQTRMTIINPERTKLQARATELKAIIRRQGKDSEAGMAAQGELKQIEGMLTQAFKTESQLNMNAFKARVDQKLTDAGIKLGKRDYDFLMRTFSSDASYMAMKRGAKGNKGSDYIAGGSYDEGSTFNYDTRNLNQKLLDLFTDKWRQENSAFLNAAFSARGAAASTMLSDARYLKEGGGGGGGRTGGGGGTTSNISPTYAADSIAAQEEEVRRLTELWRTADETLRDGYLKDLDAAKNKLTGMKLVKPTGADTDGMIAGFADTSIGEVGAGLSADVLKSVKTQAQLLAEQGERNRKAWTGAAQAVNLVGSAMSNIKDPVAATASTVAQAIANIALAYSETLAKDKTSKSNIWLFLATSAAAMVSMATTISQIHGQTGYAQGGIVKGNSYSGDNMMFGGDGLYGLNAGELVLTRAQQNSLANQLEGNGIGNLNLHGVLQGENILISIDRTLQRQGRELAVWGRGGNG